MQESVTMRTNKATQFQTTIGNSGSLKIFSGALPANCAASDPSGLLDTITLPSTFMTSSAGVASLAGTWTGNASSSGYARTYRFYDASSVCHAQGYISEAWAQSKAYAVSQQVSNTNGVYVCTTAGTSNSTGIGPSGTGTGITDGTAVWSYVTSSPELVLGSTNIASGQALNISAFSVTAGNA